MYDSKQKFLPFKIKSSFIYGVTWLIALLMVIVSLAGILYRNQIYSNETLLNTFLPNDVVNLIFGLPALLGCILLSRRDSLIGLLCWPGALLFVLYNYIAYVFALPLNMLFLLHLSLVMLSLYALFYLLANMDTALIANHLQDTFPQKLTAGVLMTLGSLFFVRVIAVIIQPLNGSASLSTAELAVNVADFLITPAWIISGVQLWRRQAWGFGSAPAMLFQASLLFLALLAFLLLQPLFTGAPFAAADVFVIGIMGLVCWVPFGLLLRSMLTR